MDLYNNLEDQHKLSQSLIDSTDIVYLMKRMARKKEQDKPKLATAEQVPWL